MVGVQPISPVSAIARMIRALNQTTSLLLTSKFSRGFGAVDARCDRAVGGRAPRGRADGCCRDRGRDGPPQINAHGCGLHRPGKAGRCGRDARASCAIRRTPDPTNGRRRGGRRAGRAGGRRAQSGRQRARNDAQPNGHAAIHACAIRIVGHQTPSNQSSGAFGPGRSLHLRGRRGRMASRRRWRLRAASVSGFDQPGAGPQ